MPDGLPKLKDFAAEFGGSGEAIAEQGRVPTGGGRQRGECDRRVPAATMFLLFVNKTRQALTVFRHNRAQPLGV